MHLLPKASPACTQHPSFQILHGCCLQSLSHSIVYRTSVVKKADCFFICLQVIFYACQNSCITCQEPEQFLFFINNSSNIVFNIKYVQENTFCSVFFISLADMKSNQICTVLIPLIIYFGSYPDNLFTSRVHDCD